MLYAAFSQGDADRCLRFLDPQIEWNSAENFIYSDQSPYIGTEAVRKLVFERLPADWDDFLWIPGEILGAGDLVIANGRFKGRFKATGAEIDAQFVQVFQFRDGRIVRCQIYTDTAQFKEAARPDAAAS